MTPATPFCCDVVAGQRRAARGDREPRRPLDPRRVPRALGARRARRAAALSDQVKAHLREQARRAPAHAAPLRPPPRPARAARAPRVFAASSREGAASLRCASSSSATRTCSTLDLDARRRAARPPAPPRLHARQARPLLRPLRPAALRGARASRSRTSWVWQSTHIGGDRFAGNLVCPPATASTTGASSASGRLAGARRRTSPDGSSSPHYRGRSCYSFAAQAAERDVREQTRAARARRPRARVEQDGARSSFARRERRACYERRRARRARRARPT